MNTGTSPLARSPAECVVRVSGREVTELYSLLAEVRVECRRSEASTATLRLEIGRDEHGRWPVLDDGVLRRWAPVVVEAAFGNARETVLRGYVRQVTARFAPEGGATVTVECQDESMALDREHVRRAWGADEPTSDLAIAREILARHQGAGGTLRLDDACAEGVSGVVAHQNGTDVQFLLKRARASGYEFLVRDGTVYFGPMRLAGDPQPTILVHAGLDSSCLGLSVVEDAHQPDEVGFDVGARNGASVERHFAAADLPLLGREAADSRAAGLGAFRWILSGEGASDANALRARAQGRANELSMKIRAEGELDGAIYGHVLQIGRTVGVEGIGEWYGGLYYVDAVTHVFSHDGYLQTFRLLRNACGDDGRRAPSERLAAVA